ncbi:MAG: hypothetical protein M1837_002992 [Sclerophora amabilis]|nr:MAG: hypothetical protein M1837_002992 [Sclerophora amabilis]
MGFQDVQSHRELLDGYHARYDADVKAGKISPLVYPYESIGPLLLILYLLIPHQRFPVVKRARLFIFSLILIFEIFTIKRCRNTIGGNGYAVGIVAGWGVLWSAALILFSDPQKDFKRVHKSSGVKRPHKSSGVPNGVPRTVSTSVNEDKANGTLAHRNARECNSDSTQSFAAGEKHPTPNGSITQSSSKESGLGDDLVSVPGFVWQNYPSTFSERVDWVLDLVCSFRGVGWSWKPSGLSAPPKEVMAQLEGSKEESVEAISVRRGPVGHFTYYTRSGLLRQKLVTFVAYYLALDVLKVTMMYDAYFWGLVDRKPPTVFPEILRQSAFFATSYRLIASIVGVSLALNAICVLAPLVMVGVIGPRFLGAKAEPWMYPDFYGGYDTVFDNGLAGWWGGWWHQLFRFGFSEPSLWIIKRCGIDRRSLKAKALQLFVAFTLSGAIHASGSYTQMPHTRPISGTMVFFILQAFGIIAQMIGSQMLERAGITQRLPNRVRQVSNFVLVHLWFYFIGPLLIDDFARGGVWLFEPVPISPMRAMGFGAAEESWWCWGNLKIRWHTADNWWQSGFAI